MHVLFYFWEGLFFLICTFLVQKLLLEEISSPRILSSPLNTAIYISFYLHALLKSRRSHRILSVFLDIQIMIFLNIFLVSWTDQFVLLLAFGFFFFWLDGWAVPISCNALKFEEASNEVTDCVFENKIYRLKIYTQIYV